MERFGYGDTNSYERMEEFSHEDIVYEGIEGFSHSDTYNVLVQQIQGKIIWKIQVMVRLHVIVLAQQIQINYLKYLLGGVRTSRLDQNVPAVTFSPSHNRCVQPVYKPQHCCKFTL